MTEPTTQSEKLEWKWVGITFLMYVVFYLVPILLGFGLLTGRFTGRIMDVFLGIWSFAGIIIIAGIAGYISKGVTIWEPALAGLTLVTVVLVYAAYRILVASVGDRFSLFHVIVPSLVMMLTVFLLSLFGAWLGERAQKLWKDKAPEST